MENVECCVEEGVGRLHRCKEAAWRVCGGYLEGMGRLPEGVGGSLKGGLGYLECVVVCMEGL